MNCSVLGRKRIMLSEFDPVIQTSPVVRFTVDVVRQVVALRLRGQVVHLPGFGARIEAPELAGAVAGHPDDVVRSDTQAARPVEGRTPRLHLARGRVDAADPVPEELRPPDGLVRRDVAAVGHGDRHAADGRIGRRQAVVGELRRRRIEAADVVGLRQRVPDASLRIEAQRVRIRAQVVADARLVVSR